MRTAPIRPIAIAVGLLATGIGWADSESGSGPYPATGFADEVGVISRQSAHDGAEATAPARRTRSDPVRIGDDADSVTVFDDYGETYRLVP